MSEVISQYSNLPPKAAANKGQTLATVKVSCLSGSKGLLTAYQLNFDDLLRELNLSPKAMLDPEARIPLTKYVSFLELAAQLSNDPDFGIKLGCMRDFKDLEVFGFVIASASTLEQAIIQTIRYVSLQQQGVKFSFHYDKHQATIEYAVLDDAIQPRRQDAEGCIAELLCLLRVAAGSDWKPNSVTFEHDAPEDITAHREIFGSDISFSCFVNAIKFPTKLLSKKMPDADPRLHEIMQKQAEIIAQGIPQENSLLIRVQSLIIKMLPTAQISIGEIAGQLNITPRTLQRRLSQYNITFRQLIEECRYKLSKDYLRNSQIPITGVAFILGYSDPTAFSKAFHRWQGCSPNSYRKNKQLRKNF